jgi:hypothetical protein
MTASHPEPGGPADADPQLVKLRAAWRARYGPLVAEQLDPDCLYSLIRVGFVEYAFTSYDSYVRALKHVWGAELVPEPLPNTVGAKLLDVAPNLHAVDPDLDDLRRSDVEGGSRFS